KAGFKVVQDASLVFKESDFQQSFFVAKKDDQYEIINHEEVVFIESFGRDVYLYTSKDTYQIKQKLYEIEGEYADYGFIRINKSQIVNKNYILKIKPLFNSRIKIILKNNQALEISRNYVDNFKEIIGF
ncbi:MAG: LytTR family DNA-binding domain-containing protein, partial [Bacilli bacterium]|nr:LytTR family DNA-binding domain-containing protein [Bacilli bacterium]